MKAPIFLLAAMASLASAAAQNPLEEAIAAVGLLPSQRAGQHLSPTELNPFSVKAKALASPTAGEGTDTQESRIRGIFKKIKVAGIRRDAQGRLSALASDLILREGEEVKPVILDQTERLVVSRVAPTHVELTFIENKESTQPRTIIMPVRTQALVAQKLFGQSEGGGELYVAKGMKPAEAAAAMAVAGAVPPAAGSSGRAALSPDGGISAVSGAAVPENPAVALAGGPSAPKALNPSVNQPASPPVPEPVLEAPNLEPVPDVPGAEPAAPAEANAVRPALTPPSPPAEGEAATQ